jgi:hypothetical protein
MSSPDLKIGDIARDLHASQPNIGGLIVPTSPALCHMDGDTSSDIPFNNLPIMEQHGIINRLMRRYSPPSLTAVVFTSLPAPPGLDEDEEAVNEDSTAPRNSWPVSHHPGLGPKTHSAERNDDELRQQLDQLGRVSQHIRFRSSVQSVEGCSTMTIDKSPSQQRHSSRVILSKQQLDPPETQRSDSKLYLEQLQALTRGCSLSASECASTEDQEDDAWTTQLPPMFLVHGRGLVVTTAI